MILMGFCYKSGSISFSLFLWAQKHYKEESGAFKGNKTVSTAAAVSVIKLLKTISGRHCRHFGQGQENSKSAAKEENGLVSITNLKGRF